MVTNVFDSSLDLGSNTSLQLVELMLLCLVLWNSESVEICRSQDFRATSLRYWLLIHLSLCDCDRTVMLEELLCMLLRSGGCWYVDSDTVLAINPFANSEPGFVFVRGFASLRQWKGLVLLDWLGWVYLVCTFMI